MRVKKLSTVEKQTRNSVTVSIPSYSLQLGACTEVEATEWANGDGIDICVKDQLIQMTWAEHHAVTAAVALLECGSVTLGSTGE